MTTGSAAKSKTEAEALALALEYGAMAVPDVIAWATSVIEREQTPHWSLCELVTMGARTNADVIFALRDVPGTTDDTSVFAEVARRLGQALAEDRTRANAIASALYRLAIDDRIPDGDLRACAGWADDALDLAEQQIAGPTREEVIDQMLAALTAFSAT